MKRQSAGPDASADDEDPLAAGAGSGQLNRSMILQTALGIVDRDGVAEMVLAELSVDSTDPDWAGQLRTVARDFRQLALTHPNVVPLLVTRPLATPLGQRPPGMLRPLEDVLALLTSAGFTGEEALHIYRVLFGYLYGHMLNELQEVIERPEETDDVLRLGLHRLAITEFPQLRALAPALASYDGAAELDRFLELLLPGMTATLTGRDGHPQPSEMHAAVGQLTD
ncbi:MAG: hypothetical protein QOH91_2977 [Mycobacterium sp.]|nr:hypothetical protein [Mycobacterium sp.]